MPCCKGMRDCRVASKAAPSTLPPPPCTMADCPLQEEVLPTALLRRQQHLPAGGSQHRPPCCKFRLLACSCKSSQRGFAQAAPPPCQRLAAAPLTAPAAHVRIPVRGLLCHRGPSQHCCFAVAGSCAIKASRRQLDSARTPWMSCSAPCDRTWHKSGAVSTTSCMWLSLAWGGLTGAPCTWSDSGSLPCRLPPPLVYPPVHLAH
jgi:hypothetical protein